MLQLNYIKIEVKIKMFYITKFGDMQITKQFKIKYLNSK
jgi:hypothetical protein